MDEKIGFSPPLAGHLKVFIPWFKEYPFAKTQKWGEAYQQNIPKAQQAALKNVPNRAAFRKKRAKPLIDLARQMTRDDFVNRKGLTKEQSISRLQKKLRDKNELKKYRRNVKYGYQAFDQGALNQAMWNYENGKSFGPYRFQEPLKLVESWLTGRPESRRLLGEKDQLISGAPVLVCRAEKKGEFKSKLYNQLLRAGKLISELGYQPEDRKRQNDKINALANNYLGEGLVPFATGGPSHIDFVLIPESITPADSRLVKEIQYKIAAVFLGEARAADLRRTSIEKDYPTPPDPAEYLGRPGKKAYFDMYLDIQVSRENRNWGHLNHQ